MPGPRTLTPAAGWLAALVLTGCGAPAQQAPRPAAVTPPASQPATPPASPATPPASPAAPPRLSILDRRPPPLAVDLEQDGKLVPLAGQEAHLAPRPFAIVVRRCEPFRGILMNVSRSSRLFEAARAGRGLEETFSPGTGMAEDAMVRDRVLIESYGGHHYLIVDLQGEPKTNRYHELRRVAGELQCRRLVEHVEVAGSSVRTPISRLRELYLVFYLAREGKSALHTALKLRFDR